jgi:hypothetical protein
MRTNHVTPPTAVIHSDSVVLAHDSMIFGYPFSHDNKMKDREETRMITSVASPSRLIVIAARHVYGWPSKAQTPAREGHQYPVRTAVCAHYTTISK